MCKTSVRKNGSFRGNWACWDKNGLLFFGFTGLVHYFAKMQGGVSFLEDIFWVKLDSKIFKNICPTRGV